MRATARSPYRVGAGPISIGRTTSPVPTRPRFLCPMNLTYSKELRAAYRAEFNSWALMWFRTTNMKSPDWKFYGARGISVCDRWRDFQKFLDDVGPKPDQSFCLARRYKTKGYYPENVFWGDRCKTVENFQHYGRKQLYCKRGYLLGPGNQVRSGSRACLACSRLTRRKRYLAEKRKEL